MKNSIFRILYENTELPKDIIKHIVTFLDLCFLCHINMSHDNCIYCGKCYCCNCYSHYYGICVCPECITNLY